MDLQTIDPGPRSRVKCLSGRVAHAVKLNTSSTQCVGEVFRVPGVTLSPADASRPSASPVLQPPRLLGQLRHGLLDVGATEVVGVVAEHEERAGVWLVQQRAAPGLHLRGRIDFLPALYPGRPSSPPPASTLCPTTRFSPLSFASRTLLLTNSSMEPNRSWYAAHAASRYL